MQIIHQNLSFTTFQLHDHDFVNDPCDVLCDDVDLMRRSDDDPRKNVHDDLMKILKIITYSMVVIVDDEMAAIFVKAYFVVDLLEMGFLHVITIVIASSFTIIINVKGAIEMNYLIMDIFIKDVSQDDVISQASIMVLSIKDIIQDASLVKEDGLKALNVRRDDLKVLVKITVMSLIRMKIITISVVMIMPIT